MVGPFQMTDTIAIAFEKTGIGIDNIWTIKILLIIWLAYFVAFLIGRHCVPIVIHCPVSFAGLDIGGADKTNAGLMRKGVYKLVYICPRHGYSCSLATISRPMHPRNKKLHEYSRSKRSYSAKLNAIRNVRGREKERGRRLLSVSHFYFQFCS